MCQTKKEGETFFYNLILREKKWRFLFYTYTLMNDMEEEKRGSFASHKFWRKEKLEECVVLIVCVYD